MVQEWHEDPLNQEHVHNVRAALTDKTRVLAFLGAGLSFGAARQLARASFDFEDRTHDENLPLPSWPWLVGRMHEQAKLRTNETEHQFLDDFFRFEGALDCAELFRRTVGEQNYAQFLLAQFDARRHPFIQPTPAHSALIDLDLPLLFTTNYDQLIEDAYLHVSLPIAVSPDETRFKATLAQRPDRHLVKVHGSIDEVTSVVLTRSDYARSRSLRREMFQYLRNQLAQAVFLFIGFSLSDPNFNLLHDDVRESFGMTAPVSYTVQGRRDPVKQRYLESLGVNTIWLGSWNYLPDFLRRIHPAATD